MARLPPNPDRNLMPWRARAFTGALVGIVAGLVMGLMIVQGALVMSFWLGAAVWRPAATLLGANLVTVTVYCIWRSVRRRPRRP